MDIHKLMDLVLEEAYIRRDNAGHSGSHHDGGASSLEEQVELYKMGMTGIIPDNWKNMEIVKTVDPEWDEYQRLLKKFKD